MAVLIVQETAEAAERRKWEAQYSPYGPGERPYVYRDLPVWVCKAGHPDDADGKPRLGKVEIVEKKLVQSADEEDQEQANGFYRDPLVAIAKFTALDVEIAKLAAEINWDVKHRLSPKAGAEVEAAQNAHAGHLPAVPETAIRRRVSKAVEGGKKLGRPKKAVAAVVAADAAGE